MTVTTDQPLACVIGSMDLIRPLALAGVTCAAVAEPESPVRYSRSVVSVIDWADPWTHGGLLVERLLRFAATCAEPPVLFYEGDGELLFVSRERQRLADGLRFLLPEPSLLEGLVDKARFAALAERLSLPVPASRVLSPLPEAAPELDLSFPVIAKPLTRRDFSRWADQTAWAKARRLDSPHELREAWPAFRDIGLDLIVQELVPGPETLIESHHAYVDATGHVVAEFTGRKIRTRPPEYGFSTSVEVTDEPEVAAVGRDVLARLGLTGVAKLDFKRAPDGRLRLLEVNARFNLWHHAGALAGVNLPALAYADLTGRPRPAVGAARPGVRWVHHVKDAPAAREGGVPLWRWVPWALATEAKSTFARDDPMPFVRGVAWNGVRRRAQRLARRLRGRSSEA